MSPLTEKIRKQPFIQVKWFISSPLVIVNRDFKTDSPHVMPQQIDSCKSDRSCFKVNNQSG